MCMYYIREDLFPKKLFYRACSARSIWLPILSFSIVLSKSSVPSRVLQAWEGFWYSFFLTGALSNLDFFISWYFELSANKPNLSTSIDWCQFIGLFNFLQTFHSSFLIWGVSAHQILICSVFHLIELTWTSNMGVNFNDVIWRCHTGQFTCKTQFNLVRCSSNTERVINFSPLEATHSYQLKRR